MIALLSFAALIVLILLLLIFGAARLHVVYSGDVRVIASLLGIRFTVFSDKKSAKKKSLVKCRNPQKALKKEQRLLEKQKKKQEKQAQKRKLKATKKKKKTTKTASGEVVEPNLVEKIEMVSVLLRELYTETHGKLRVRVKALHISVGTDDAAKTAILYGLVLQSVSCLLGWIDTTFTRLRHKDGELSVTADYTSGKCRANLHIVCSISLLRGIIVVLRLLSAKDREEKIALEKAKERLAANSKVA